MAKVVLITRAVVYIWQKVFSSYMAVVYGKMVLVPRAVVYGKGGLVPRAVVYGKRDFSSEGSSIWQKWF